MYADCVGGFVERGIDGSGSHLRRSQLEGWTWGRVGSFAMLSEDDSAVSTLDVPHVRRAWHEMSFHLISSSRPWTRIFSTFFFD